MRTAFCFGRICASLALVAACLTPAASVHAAATQGQAIVQGVKGNASYLAPGSTEWKPLAKGTVLVPGSSVRTESDSQVHLFLGVNGPIVCVNPKSILDINKLSYEETGVETIIDTQLHVRQGDIVGIVKKQSKGSNYEVKNAAGIAGIVEGAFNINASGETHLTEGTAAVAPNTAQSPSDVKSLKPGQSYVPSNLPQMSVGATPSELFDRISHQVGLCRSMALEMPKVPYRDRWQPLNGTKDLTTGQTGLPAELGKGS